MRAYQFARRRADPLAAMYERARERAAKRNLAFDLNRSAMVLPERCPVLGERLQPGGERSSRSPSLDRVDPTQGYTQRNTRVISDEANRLKSGHSLLRLQELAQHGRSDLRSSYSAIVRYVEREQLLAEVWRRADMGGAAGEEWAKVARFLEIRFSLGEF